MGTRRGKGSWSLAQRLIRALHGPLGFLSALKGRGQRRGRILTLWGAGAPPRFLIALSRVHVICVLSGAPAICLPPSKPRRLRGGDTLPLGSKWGHKNHKHAADTVPSTFHDELTLPTALFSSTSHCREDRAVPESPRPHGEGLGPWVGRPGSEAPQASSQPARHAVSLCPGCGSWPPTPGLPVLPSLLPPSAALSFHMTAYCCGRCHVHRAARTCQTHSRLADGALLPVHGVELPTDPSSGPSSSSPRRPTPRLPPRSRSPRRTFLLFPKLPESQQCCLLPRCQLHLWKETRGTFCDEPLTREGHKEWVVLISQMVTRHVQSPLARAADP